MASGSDADTRALSGSDANVVELDGVTVLRGFVDTHPQLKPEIAVPATLAGIANLALARDITSTSDELLRHNYWVLRTVPGGETVRDEGAL